MKPTPVRRALLPLGAVIVSFVLAACGGGGGGAGGGGDGGNGDGGGGASGMPPASSQVGDEVAATLATGSYWEYLADYQQQSTSAGGGSTDTDWGIFRVTLGAPASVAGVSGFAVTVTGKTTTGGHDFTPKYSFIGLSGERWVGSTDGATLVTLYDPSLANGSNGFFLNLGTSRPVKTQVATFDGRYNDFVGVSLSDSSSSGGCEYVLSTTICTQDSTSFSQLDYLKDGIGPVGFKLNSNYSFGGTVPQVISTALSVELIGTSLVPKDGSTLKAPPWSIGTDLPTARFGGSAAALGGKIYLYTTNLVDVFDPATQAWSVGAAAPTSIAAAITIGAKIAVFTSRLGGYLHDPVAGTWAPLPAVPDTTGADTLEGAVPWTHADGSTDVVLLVSRGNAYVDLNVWQYQTATNTWVALGSVNRGGYSGFRVASAADKVYLFGGYQSGTFLSNVMVLDLKARTFGDIRKTLTTQGISQATQTFGGKIYVLGGSNGGGAYRTVDIIDPASDTVTPGPAMYEPREDGMAVVLGDKLYVIGGQASGSVLKTVEILTP